MYNYGHISIFICLIGCKSLKWLIANSSTTRAKIIGVVVYNLIAPLKVAKTFFHNVKDGRQLFVIFLFYLINFHNLHASRDECSFAH